VSGQAAQFILQVLPIAAGALFVLAVKGVRLPEPGIQVRFSGEAESSPDDCGKGGDTDAPPSTAGLPAECREIRGSRELGEAVALYLSTPQTHTQALWNGYQGRFEDMRERVFERFVYDELITNGILNSRTDSCSSHKIAFEKLGILDAKKAEDLGKYLARQKVGMLKLFACGSPDLSRTLSFDGGYGLLLAYLTGYTLEKIGV
jgi:hypothetical protein